ncbi:septum formation protein [Palleronia salina]|uniref:dTTP/UTP pyrophosphatase n=1 Tax=Palleronia salina TaxID=313368 RepID=A0A1M6M513_9RHOB|nr:septum formation protein [Palleronia salina]
MGDSLRLVLGSGSPRRRELLAQIGLTPADIRAPDIDETPLKGELPRPYCARMAEEKAAAVTIATDEVLLCADTTVAMGRRILGKPADEAEARDFLARLSGRRHRVYTGVAVRRGAQSWSRTVESTVRLKQLSKDDIDGYIATGDWQGKAGGYAIQGPAAVLVAWMQGSFSGVVGLPLHETANLLQTAGLPIWGAR